MFVFKKITYSPERLEDNPYLEFSTGINIKEHPTKIDEYSFDDEISMDTCLPFIKGMKLLIEDSLIFPIKGLIKHKCVSKGRKKIVEIEDNHLSESIFGILKEYEYTKTFFFANYSKGFQVDFPNHSTEGISFNFESLEQLLFIRIEEGKIIIFHY